MTYIQQRIEFYEAMNSLSTIIFYALLGLFLFQILRKILRNKKIFRFILILVLMLPVIFLQILNYLRH